MSTLKPMGDYAELPPWVFPPTPTPHRPEPFAMGPADYQNPPSISEQTEYIPPSHLHDPSFTPIEDLGGPADDAKPPEMDYASVGMSALQNAFGHHADEPADENVPWLPLNGYEMVHMAEQAGKSLKVGGASGPSPLLAPEFLFHMHMFGDSEEDTGA